MQKIKLLLTVALMVTVSAAFGQKEKTISLIKAGSTLTDADVGFLSMVSNATVTPGTTNRQVTIGGVVYKKGTVLTAANAKSLNAAVDAFQKGYKAPVASRGTAGLCYYWYYYCNYYGYCYYYKYYYYCY